MEYCVKITDNAIQQMQDITEYIAMELMAPDTADRWLTHMENEVRGLGFMPERIPLIEEKAWRAMGIRKLVVDNFLVYFHVDEMEKTVWVTAIVYGGRDQKYVLTNMPLE